jgi:type II secretory pathway predicted ATPase ExeA
LLIVDEAQNLSAAALESLRMLSNINADKDQLLQMILVGQPQLMDILRRPELQQFVQRVSTHFFIPPLDAGDVERYIRHRLQVAGRDEALFTSAACGHIAKVSRGIPRTVNILCDTALVYGFSGDAAMIDVDLIDEVIRDQAEFGVFSLDPAASASSAG